MPKVFVRYIVILIFVGMPFCLFWQCDNPQVKREKMKLKSADTLDRAKRVDTLSQKPGEPDTAKLEIAENTREEPEVKLPIATPSADSGEAKPAVDTISQTSEDLPPESKKDTTYYADSTFVDTFNFDPDFPEGMSDPYYEDRDDFKSGDLKLRKERLIKTERAEVLLPEFKNQYDSTLAAVEERMSIHPAEISETVIIERWLSPVNYRGYKFNLKKIMLYGVDKDAPIHVFYYLDGYYLGIGEEVYYLQEATKNTGLTTVADTLIEKYLLNYEAQL